MGGFGGMGMNQGIMQLLGQTLDLAGGAAQTAVQIGADKKAQKRAYKYARKLRRSWAEDLRLQGLNPILAATRGMIGSAPSVAAPRTGGRFQTNFAGTAKSIVGSEARRMRHEANTAGNREVTSAYEREIMGVRALEAANAAEVARIRNDWLQTSQAEQLLRIGFDLDATRVSGTGALGAGVGLLGATTGVGVRSVRRALERTGVMRKQERRRNRRRR